MIKLLFLIASLNPQLPQDSIGLETINGQVFVIHKVEEKETLFAISRRYKTTVDAILQYNVTAGSGLEIGQILKVPYTPQLPEKRDDGIVHIVAPGETLYAVSRAYNVSMEDLQRWNNLRDAGLAIGQRLVIRRSPSVTAPQPVQHARAEPVSIKGSHTVVAGETLYGIARQYEISVEQLREWNHLHSNELSIGQTLYVHRPEQNAAVTSPVVTAKVDPQPARQEPVVQEPTVRREPVTPQETASDARPTEKNTTTTTTTTPAPGERGQSAESIRISESLKNGDEIVEAGLAELIEDTGGNRKYLALHRTAPMGTILKVRNEMNNREVFVRVTGKLPDIALTDKLIIKISKSAYDRLGAIDPRFRVEVTYYK